MKQSAWQRFDIWARNITPFIIALLLVMISVIPTHLPGFTQVSPLLALIAVYHWGVYRPDLMPSLAVFILGLFQDLIGGGPMGLHAFVLLVMYGMLLTQRRFFYGKSFMVIWLGFAIVASSSIFAYWAIASIYYLKLLQPYSFGFQYIITLTVFPVISWMLVRWQRAFIR